MKQRITLSALALALVLVQTAGAQTYRILVQENFGSGTSEPSSSPASDIAPGTTSYTPLTSATTLWDGSYATARNPQGFDNFGSVINAWQHGYDHTTGTQAGQGYMMLINANPGKQGEANGSYYLYQSSVFDVPGAQYNIDFWGANVLAYDLGSSSTASTKRYSTMNFKEAYIGLAIRNTPNASGTLYNTSGTNSWIMPRATGNQNYIPWNNYNASFTLPTNYNAAALYFNFFNSDNNSSSNGNDLAIDDITIKMRVMAISGMIFNDVNGNNTIDAGETGINGTATPLYAYLTKANGTIISSVPVSATGAYRFDETVTPNTGVPYIASDVGMKITFSSASYPVGGTLNAAAPPTGFVIIGENVNGAANAADNIPADGIINLTATTTDMSNLNFAIERAPESAVSVLSGQSNPGGFTNVVVPASAFTTSANSALNPNTQDYDGGTVTNIRITGFPTNANSITIGGATYTNGGVCPPATSCQPWPAAGIVLPYSNLPAVSVDPLDGSVNVAISFAAVDNAGKEDPTPGSITLPFTSLAISGKVFNDANGLSGTPANTVDGTPIGTAGAAALYATLLDASRNPIRTVAVKSNGTYTFDSLQANSTYNIVIGTNSSGSTASPFNGPAGSNNWVSTGEHIGNGAGSDGTPDGSIQISMALTSIGNVNFGLDRKPVASDVTTTVAQPHIGTTIPLNGSNGNGPVPPATDAEDGTLGAGKTIVITTIPANTTLYYKGTAVTNGQTIINLNPDSLSVVITTATINSSSTSFQFSYIDAAGLQGNTATYTLNWGAPLPILISSFDAVAAGTTSLLTWSTSEEINSKAFDIERSSDGRVWSTLATVAAAGDSRELRRYSYTDQLPLQGINRYRLKMIDRDEQYVYSEIRTVRFDNKAIVVKLYPNPAKEALHLFLAEPLTGTAEIRILDMQGRLVYRAAAGQSTQQAVPIDNLSPGSYIFHIISSGQLIFKTKLVKE